MMQRFVGVDLSLAMTERDFRWPWFCVLRNPSETHEASFPVSLIFPGASCAKKFTCPTEQSVLSSLCCASYIQLRLYQPTMPSSSPSPSSGPAADFSALVALAMANAEAVRLEQRAAANPWQHLGPSSVAAAPAATRAPSHKRPKQNHNRPNSTSHASGGPVVLDPPEVIVIDSDEDETTTLPNNATLASDVNPQNPEENRLLKEIPQFQAYIVLRTVRRIKGSMESDSPTSNTPLTAMQVLMQIPAEQQRIQDEQQQLLDARQMDQARLMSEEENQKRLQEERKRLKERIKVAPFAELLQIFANSWLLHSSNNTDNELRAAVAELGSMVKKCASLRKRLVKILQIEQDAQKYYKTVAEVYFVSKVQPALDDKVTAASSSSSSLREVERFIKEQVDCLEKAMYSRSGKSSSSGINGFSRDYSDAVVAGSRSQLSSHHLSFFIL